MTDAPIPVKRRSPCLPRRARDPYSGRMVTKLRAIGDALGVIIEPELLDQVAIDRDTPLEIHVEGQTLVIRPSRASLRERVRAINAEMMEIHAETLRRLAE